MTEVYSGETHVPGSEPLGLIGAVGTDGKVYPFEVDPVSGRVLVDISAGSLPLPSGAATEVTLDDARDLLVETWRTEPLTQGFTVSTMGNNTVVTPTTGKKLVIYAVSAQVNPEATSSPVVTIRFDAGAEIYRGYSFARRVRFTGATNQVLQVHLSAAETVAGTIYYQEVD